MVKNEFLYRLSPSYICSIIDWIFVIAQQLHIDFASFEFKILKKPAMDDEFDWDSVICVLESISSPIKDNVLPKKFNIDLELTTFWYGRFLLEGINSISSDEFIQLWDNRLPYPCKGLPSLNLLKVGHFSQLMLKLFRVIIFTIPQIRFSIYQEISYRENQVGGFNLCFNLSRNGYMKNFGVSLKILPCRNQELKLLY